MADIGKHGVYSGDVMQSSVFTKYVEPSMSRAFNLAGTSGPDFPDLASIDALIASSKVKRIVRSTDWPVSHEIRKRLWLKLCNASFDCKVVCDPAAYIESVQSVFGEGDDELHNISLPPFVDKSCQERRYLTDAGFSAVKRILCVIAHERPDITHSPTLLTMTCIFLHYLDEATTYACVCALLCSKQRYIAQTSIAYDARALVLRELSHKYAKSWYQSVMKSSSNGDKVFAEWHWWLLKDLPFPYLIRVFDCFILEGPKVLYRVALSILIHYNKHASAARKTQPANKIPEPEGFQVESSIRKFCAEIPVPVHKLLKTAFGIRGLSRSEIGKLLLKKELCVQSLHNAAALKATVPPSQSTGSLNVVVGLDVTGNIMTRSEWRELYKWLPKRYTLSKPTLVFSTHDHGTSMNTLYGKICGHEPTFMAIKTNGGEVIGAFCSIDWSKRYDPQRGRVYFGTGESFVCQLIPSRIKYSWVGLTLGQQTPYSAQLFCSGDNTQIVIGGGNGTAIMLDENLNKGHSQHCDTFDNAPLVSSNDGSFVAVIIEVFAFD